MRDTIVGPETLGVPTIVWASFLRLVTNPRLLEVPATASEALDFADALVTSPSHLHTEPGPRHLRLVRGLCAEGEATGDLVPDVVLAAIALETGSNLVSFVRDFLRLPSIRLVRPS